MLASPSSSRLVRAWWTLPVVWVPLALAWPCLAGAELLYRDILHFVAPHFAFAAEALKSGRIPEWNPLLFSGTPLLAEPGNGVLYPPTLVCLLLFSPGLAATVSVLVHLPLAGAGAYLLARELDIDRPFAALAGVAYGAGGYLLSVHGSGYYFASAAWLPMALWALLRVAAEWSPRRVAIAGGTIGLMVLNGDLQAPYLAGIIGVLLAIVRPNRVLALARVGGALALGLAIGCVQVLPTLAFSRTTVRASGLSFEEASRWSMSPVRLLEFFAPTPFGAPFPDDTSWAGAFANGPTEHPWAFSYCVGAPIAVAAIIALARRSTPTWRVLAFATLAALLLAFGLNTPVFRAWHALVPLANRFRYPEKFGALLSLGVVLLGARGLASGLVGPRVLGVASALFAIAAGVASSRPAFLATEIGVAIAKMHGENAPDPYTTLGSSLGEAAALCAVAALALFMGRTRPHAAPVLLVFAVSLTAASNGLHLLSYGDASFLSTPPEIWSELKEAAAPESTGRFLAVSDCGNRSLPGATGSQLERERAYAWHAGSLNGNEMAGIGTVLGYSAAHPIEVRALTTRVPPVPPERPARLLGAAAMRSCALDGVPRAFTVSHPLPRLAYRTPIRVPADRVADAYTAPDFELDRLAIVSDDVPESPPADDAMARISCDEPEHVIVETTGGGGFLVLTDRLLDGWSVTIDGTPADVHRANMLWRGVLIPAGAHEIEWRYRTPWLRLGAIVSLVAAVVLIAMGLVGRRAKAT